MRWAEKLRSCTWTRADEPGTVAFTSFSGPWQWLASRSKVWAGLCEVCPHHRLFTTSSVRASWVPFMHTDFHICTHSHFSCIILRHQMCLFSIASSNCVVLRLRCCCLFVCSSSITLVVGSDRISDLHCNVFLAERDQHHLLPPRSLRLLARVMLVLAVTAM